MIVRVKPRAFGPVVAFYDRSETVCYATDLVSERSPHPPKGSPVDMLMVSLAYCIVKSVELAANSHRASLHPFAVRVTGTKALDLPGRVEQMNLTIIGELVDDSAMAEKIVRQAKSICTVSNTLNCAVTVTMEAAADG